jgi:hypothetical protein
MPSLHLVLSFSRFNSLHKTRRSGGFLHILDVFSLAGLDGRHFLSG